jgi:hypothetical protein
MIQSHSSSTLVRTSSEALPCFSGAVKKQEVFVAAIKTVKHRRAHLNLFVIESVPKLPVSVP